MKNLIKLESQELNLVEESKAKQIRQTFEPMVEMLDGFEEVFNEVIQEAKDGITTEVSAKAKRVRLDIGKIRIETKKLKDKQKEKIKLEDKAIMGVHNILVWAVQEKEEKLKEIENHFEEVERLRIIELQKERVLLLEPFVEGAEERDLSGMEDDVWKAFLSMKKNEYNDKIAAVKKAEEDRIAKEKAEEVARQKAEKERKAEEEKVRAENEKLKKEAEEKAKIEAIEKSKREKVEKERKAEAEKKQKEHDDKVLAMEQEKAKIEADAEKERKRIQAELDAKAKAEQEKKEQLEQQNQLELKKGDQDKFNDLINDLETLKTKYSFKNKVNIKKYQDVSVLINKIINHVNN